jgi:hypothetical protein
VAIESISPTLVSQWLTCQTQVRFRRLENLIIPPGIAMDIGTGLHKAAQYNYIAKMGTGKDEPLDAVQDAARDGYRSIIDNEGVFIPYDEMPSAKKQIAAGQDMAVSLAECFYFSDANQKRIPKKVEELLVYHDPRIPLPIKGFVDVIDDQDIMADIKSAARKWPEGKAEKEIQPTFYQKLYAETYDVNPAHFVYDIFTKTKTPAHQQVITSRTNEDYEIIINIVDAMLKSISAGIFMPADPGSWKCNPKYCGYWFRCGWIPAHKKILPKRSV